MMDCIVCDAPMRQRWNVDYCSPSCALAGDLGIEIEAYNLGLR